MPLVLPKVIHSTWAHTQGLQFCQNQYMPHRHTPNACNSAKGNQFHMGTRSMRAKFITFGKAASSGRVAMRNVLLMEAVKALGVSPAECITFGTTECIGRVPLRNVLPQAEVTTLRTCACRRTIGIGRLHAHTPNTFICAKSDKFWMGTRPMPSDLPKIINFPWAHTQQLQLCQK